MGLHVRQLYCRLAIQSRIWVIGTDYLHRLESGLPKRCLVTAEKLRTAIGDVVSDTSHMTSKTSLQTVVKQINCHQQFQHWQPKIMG
jgi:hypothetical protein